MTSRVWFTPEQKAELWERWKQGHGISTTSRVLEWRNRTGVQRIVALHGGIAPPPRRRAASAIRLEERDEISRGITAGRSIPVIARVLGRSPSTICREVARKWLFARLSRNGGRQAGLGGSIASEAVSLGASRSATLERGAEAGGAVG